MPRRLRADALENEDRVLQAAAAAFARPGLDTSMKAIARDAGVGIATLYRRFPSREQLIEAVYRTATRQLAESAEVLLESMAPRQALREWLGYFLDYMLTKEGMSEALPAILAREERLRLHSRDLLRDAIALLLGADDGSLRTDVTADDVMMAIGGVAVIAAHESDRDLANRLADLLVAGLDVRAESACTTARPP